MRIPVFQVWLFNFQFHTSVRFKRFCKFWPEMVRDVNMGLKTESYHLTNQKCWELKRWGGMSIWYSKQKSQPDIIFVISFTPADCKKLEIYPKNHAFHNISDPEYWTSSISVHRIRRISQITMLYTHFILYIGIQ